MSYEPGVLVRRQQREYPPELRREIALAALEVGNNREVARLYSERLGYTVNESTVRGIKKRYLEGVHKGKIDSPGLSPRSGGDSNHGDGDKDSEGEAGEMDTSFHADNVMKLQIDVLEGKMKDGHGVEVDDCDIEDNDNLDDSDMNGTSTLVISESALSINGDGEESEGEDCHQLSIDTGAEGDGDQDLPLTLAKPSIRIAKGLTRDSNENHAPLGILAATLAGGGGGTKRKQSNGLVSPVFTNGVSPPSPAKKQRPNAAENDLEIVSLEKEVRALQWLARRKEREWDQVISLLKQKEERLVKAQRAKVLIQAEAEHLLSKYKQPSPVLAPAPAPSLPVVVPQQQVLLLPAPVTAPAPPTPTTTNRLIQPKPASATLTVKAVSSSPATAAAVSKTVTSTSVSLRSSKSPSPAAAAGQKMTNGGTELHQEQKFSASSASAAEKATKNLQKAASGGGGAEAPAAAEVKKTPDCQGCGMKKSEFVCAGCSNRWYCSRECQVDDWDEHADDCSG